MAYKIVDEVMAADKRGLTGNDVAILFAVAWHANEETRRAWPGNGLLVQETGVAERTVRNSIQRLSKGWLTVTFEGYRKRILTVSENLPMRQPVPDDAATSAGTRQPLPDDPATSAGDPATIAAEQVSNQSEEQVTEPVSEPGRDFVSRQGGVVVPLPSQPITSNKDVLTYLQKQIGIVCRDQDLPRPGGVNQAAALGRLKQIRAEGLSVEEIVELADLYVKAPTLWNPLTHPVMDFVTGTTQARLRNRRHEIRVTSSEPRATPLRNEGTLEKMRKLAEGSD